jgi:hypothetical protein
MMQQQQQQKQHGETCTAAGKQTNFGRVHVDQALL